jgi:hypothetical protein
LLERAELDDRACTTFKRLVAGFAQLSELPSFIVTMFIGFPDSMAFVVNGIAIVRVVPRSFVTTSPEVAAM